MPIVIRSGGHLALMPRDYDGVLSTVAATRKRFFNNGVLGTGSYVDPDSLRRYDELKPLERAVF